MILQPRLSLLFGEAFSGRCIDTAMINNQIQQLKKRTYDPKFHMMAYSVFIYEICAKHEDMDQ